MMSSVEELSLEERADRWSRLGRDSFLCWVHLALSTFRQSAHPLHDRLWVVALGVGLRPRPATDISVRAHAGISRRQAALQKPRAEAHAEAGLGRLRLDDEHELGLADGFDFRARPRPLRSRGTC